MHINLGIGELTEETIRLSGTFVGRIYDVHKTDWHILPPTSDALRFHLMQVRYQSMVWRNAHCAVPHELPAPVNMGWEHGDSGLQPMLMSLSPLCMPETMQDASLQMPQIRVTMHSNVCMSATE